MSRTRRSVSILVLTMLSAMLLTTCLASAESPEPTKRVSTNKHPYLLFTMDELSELRTQAKEVISDKFHASLKRKLGRAKRKPAGDVGFLAFAGLWLEDADAIDRAKGALLTIADGKAPDRYTVHTGRAMRTYAYGYDWLWAKLNTEERKKVQDYIVRMIRKGMSQWSGKTEQRGGNWQASIYGSFVACGLALINDVPEAREWAATGIKGITDGYLRMTMDSQGAVFEPYVRYQLNVSFLAILPAMDAYKRVTGENPFLANDSMLQRHMTYYANMLYPNRKGICNFGNSKPGLYPIFPYLVKTAAEYKDGLAAWYLKRHIEDGVGANNWGILCYFIWAGEAAKAIPEAPDTSPRLSLAMAHIEKAPGRHMPNTGQIFMRTGFERTDDIQLAVPGNLACHHGHADKSSYIFNALGETFLRDSYLHKGSYSSPSASFFRSDQAHNVVFVDDGGQTYIRGGGLRDRHYGSDLARVEAFQHGKTADYARINLTRAVKMHPAHKRVMKHAIRHIVFLRGERPNGAFVIIDDFEKDADTHTYSHNFQPGADVEVVSTDGGRIVLKGKGASCLVAVVHPDKVRVEKLEQFGSKYLKVICEEPVVRLNLVTVLYPTKGDATKAPVSKTVKGDTIIVKVGDRTVTFNKTNGKIMIDGKATTALGRQSAADTN